MKRFLLIPLVLFVSFALLRTSLFVPTIKASSQQAYQDYLYQSDIYRQKYNDFKVAQNEYLKFGTLTSQQTALTVTLSMMTQRDLLLRTYLLLLNEKLNETSGMADSDRAYYQTLIKNEISFLDKHRQLIPAVASIDDAVNVSKQLESHYNILQGSMLQIISGISLGNLTALANLYDQYLADAKALVNINRGIFTPEKQSLLDRWLLQITNTKSLYQGKIDNVNSKIAALKGASSSYYSNADPNSLFADSKKLLREARQYLLEGSSYLGELVRELKYQD